MSLRPRRTLIPPDGATPTGLLTAAFHFEGDEYYQ